MSAAPGDPQQAALCSGSERTAAPVRAKRASLANWPLRGTEESSRPAWECLQLQAHGQGDRKPAQWGRQVHSQQSPGAQGQVCPGGEGRGRAAQLPRGTTEAGRCGFPHPISPPETPGGCEVERKYRCLGKGLVH